MVDYFALAVSHGLMALAAWRLMLRRDLDEETPARNLARGKPTHEREAPARRSADA